MPTYKSPGDAGTPLHRLLLKAVPENQHGNKTILHLAKVMGINRWSINKWVKADRLAPERVVQLVEVSKIKEYREDGKHVLGEARVTRAEFDPFVYNF
jgi:ribosomal protein L18E